MYNVVCLLIMSNNTFTQCIERFEEVNATTEVEFDNLTTILNDHSVLDDYSSAEEALSNHENVHQTILDIKERLFSIINSLG